MQYRTKEGDVLDDICHRYYQGDVRAVEVVLNANLGLARKGPLLPPGLLIELPKLPLLEKAARVVLWE